MADPDSTDQTFHPAESRMRRIRRVWKWGIGFWILAWIYSALLVQLGISFNFSGFGMGFVVFEGSFIVGINHGISSGGIEWIAPEFVFREGYLKDFLNYPEDNFGMLGRAELELSASEFYFVFPMAGVLWFWLLLGWTEGFRKFQWLKSVKNPRLLARIVILFGLPLLISFSEYKGRKNDEMVECIMTTRNIQQAVRGHQGMNNLGNDPLDWNDIIGPSGYLPQECSKCPSGLPYRLSKNIPDVGELAAECQNPEHLKRIKSNGKIDGW